MANRIVEAVEQAYLKKEAPQFSIGDTVDVATRIIEGEKERIQVFSGIVIARKGRGINETFTVRRIVNNEGVERIFPLHSPFIASVHVERSGQSRPGQALLPARSRGQVGPADGEAPGETRSPRDPGHPRRRRPRPGRQRGLIEANRRLSDEDGAIRMRHPLSFLRVTLTIFPCPRRRANGAAYRLSCYRKNP